MTASRNIGKSKGQPLIHKVTYYPNPRVLRRWDLLSYLMRFWFGLYVEITQDTLKNRDLKMSFCRSSDKGALTDIRWIIVTHRCQRFPNTFWRLFLFAGRSILLQELTGFRRCSFASIKTTPTRVWTYSSKFTRSQDSASGQGSYCDP